MADIGWTTLGAANAYFGAERLDSTAWMELTDAKRSAALSMAYNRLRFCQDFSIPASPSAAELEKLKYGQFEMAYYLALHQADEDRRKGLQAQGVTNAGLVKEGYAESGLDKLPIPPIVRDLLADFSSATNAYVRDIARDENYHVSDDVTELEGKLN